MSTPGHNKSDALAQFCGRELKTHDEVRGVGTGEVGKHQPVRIAACHNGSPDPTGRRVTQLTGGDENLRSTRL